jgi:hypothetical protein
LPEEPIVPVIRQQDNKAATNKERRISEDVERSRRIAAEVCLSPRILNTLFRITEPNAKYRIL